MLGLVLLLPGCVDPGTDLAYRFDQGSIERYLWEITSQTTIDSPSEQSSKTSTLKIRVRELIVKTKGSGGTVQILLTPIAFSEDGFKGPPPDPTTAELEILRTGKVGKVLKAADLPAERIAALELDRLLSETRPPLPGKLVTVGQKWSAPLRSAGETTSIHMGGSGELRGFVLRQRRRLADVNVERNGSVKTRQLVGRSVYNLRGKSTASTSALIDVDRGTVFSSRSSSKTTFTIFLGESTERSSAVGTVEVKLTSVLKPFADLRSDPLPT